MTKLTKEQALDKIKELQEYVEDLDKPETGLYSLRMVDDGDIIYTLEDLIEGSAFSIDKFTANGNESYPAFTDEEQAQRVADALTVWKELCVCDGAEEYVEGKKQYSIEQEGGDDEFAINWWNDMHRPFVVYFSTEEQAEAAIKKLGEEKLKKLFML